MLDVLLFLMVMALGGLINFGLLIVTSFIQDKYYRYAGILTIIYFLISASPTIILTLLILV